MKIKFTQMPNGSWWFHIGAMYSMGGFASKEAAEIASKRYAK